MFDKKQLIRMFLPVFLENTSITLINMLVSIIVSGIGEYAISATGMVGNLSSLAMFFFAGITTGTIVKISQYYGAKDFAACKKVASQAIFASVVIAVVIAAIMVIFSGSIINFLFGDAQDNVRSAATLYLTLGAVSWPFYALYSTSNGVIYGTGDFKRSLKNTLVINVLNVAAIAFFVKVCDLGIAGAGLGLIVSRGLCSILVYRRIRKGTDYIKIESALKKPEKSTIFAVLKISIPTSLDNILTNGSGMLVQMCVVQLGSVALAANSIATSLSGVLLMPGSALAAMSVTIVGQCFGAGDLKACRRYMVSMVLAGVALVAVTCGASFLFIDGLVGLYNPEPETVGLTKQVLTMMMLCYPIVWPPAGMSPAVLRGCGDVKYSATCSVLIMIFVRVPTAWLFGITLGWGLPGVWISMFVEWAMRGILIMPRIFTKRWQRLDRI